MKHKFILFLSVCFLLIGGPAIRANSTDASTILPVAPPCNLPAPANLQYVQTTPYLIHFNWDSVPGAAGYRSVLTRLSNGSQQTTTTTPDNATFSVVPGESYHFMVAAACSFDPLSFSTEISETILTTETIIIELIVQREGCTPVELVPDNNPSPNVWGHNWVNGHDYYIELTKVTPNSPVSQKIWLSFRRTDQGFQLGELTGDSGNGNICGQAVSGLPNNCTPPPIDAYNAKVAFEGRTCRFSFPSMAEIYYYTNPFALPTEVPFDGVRIFRTCNGGHDGGGGGTGTGPGGRSDQEFDAPGADPSEFQVSPVNPFSDQLTLHFASTPDGPVKTRLFDLQGIPKIETVILPAQLDQNVYSIPADALPAGMYFLLMETAQGQVIVQKVLKI